MATPFPHEPLEAAGYEVTWHGMPRHHAQPVRLVPAWRGNENARADICLRGCGRGAASYADRCDGAVDTAPNRETMMMLMRTTRAGAVLLAALLGCAAARSSTPTTYVFTFHHLLFINLPATDPNRFVDVSGTFTGDDANHDGELSLGELTNFNFGTSNGPVGGPYQLLPSVPTQSFVIDCIPEPDPERCRRWSRLDSFRYPLGSNDLHASGEYPIGDDATVSFTAPNGLVSEGIPSESVELLWTPDTWTSVRPVPEPPMAFLSILGLAVVWRRWRRGLQGVQ